MIPLGAKVVLSLAAVVFGFAVAIIIPKYNERQQHQERQRRYEMPYENRRNNSNVVNEISTCAICCHCYDDKNRRPLLLPCSHSFCQSCLKQLETDGSKSCPICRKSWGDKKVVELLCCYQLIP